MFCFLLSLSIISNHFLPKTWRCLIIIEPWLIWKPFIITNILSVVINYINIHWLDIGLVHDILISLFFLPNHNPPLAFSRQSWREVSGDRRHLTEWRGSLDLAKVHLELSSFLSVFQTLLRTHSWFWSLELFLESINTEAWCRGSKLLAAASAHYIISPKLYSSSQHFSPNPNCSWFLAGQEVMQCWDISHFHHSHYFALELSCEAGWSLRQQVSVWVWSSVGQVCTGRGLMRNWQ